VRWLPPSKKSGREGRWHTLGIACAIALAAVMIGAWCGWYDINLFERRWYIDARSGRIREDCSVLGLRVRTTIEEAPFSALARDYSLATQPPRWLRTHARIRSMTGSLTRRCGDDTAAVLSCSRLVTAFELFEAAGMPLSEEERRGQVGLFLQLMEDEKPDEMYEAVGNMHLRRRRLKAAREATGPPAGDSD